MSGVTAVVMAMLLAACSGAPAPSAIQFLEPCEPNFVFRDLAWSPDGETILSVVEYFTNSGTVIKLATVRSSGDGQMKMLADTDNAYQPASWSPDSGQIVFMSFAEDDDPPGCSPDCLGQMFVMAADGSGKQPLFDGSNHYKSPTWSPDGKLIAFDKVGGGNPGIAIVHPDGSGLRVFSGQFDFAPAWSPDGKQIAVWSVGAGQFRPAVVNADGSNRKVLNGNLKTAIEKPVWLPDGSGIAYTSEVNGGEAIEVAWLDGRKPTVVIDDPAARDANPAWSRDRKRVLFISDRQRHIVQIFGADGDGSHIEQMTRGNAPNYEPVWSPDGTRIAFVSQRDGGSEIYVMNADGSDQTRITQNPANQDCLKWPF